VKNSKLLTIFAFVVAVTLIFSTSVMAISSELLDEYLASGELGPYQPDEEDWDEIIAAAQEEGELTLYSISSRHPSVAEDFEEKYGIDVEYVIGLDTDEQISRLEAQQAADSPEVDVLYLGQEPTVLSYVQEGRLVSYVPSKLQDENIIPEAYRYPVLDFSTEVQTVHYNNETYDEPPIDSWWDITKPEWEGRIYHAEAVDQDWDLRMYSTWIENHEELEEEYEKIFGEPIEYTQPFENAGYELLKRYLENTTVIPSSEEWASTIGSDGFDGLGIHGSTHIRRNEHLLKEVNGELNIPLMLHLSPKGGTTISQTMLISGTAPNPNAAKLFLLYSLDDDGYNPWASPGSWAPRVDWEPHPYTPELDLENLWVPDIEFMGEIIDDLIDFIDLYY